MQWLEPASQVNSVFLVGIGVPPDEFQSLA